MVPIFLTTTCWGGYTNVITSLLYVKNQLALIFATSTWSCKTHISDGDVDSMGKKNGPRPAT
ncbi:hypothetical protein BH18ACT5_BH18ACT5_02530 [soil metagenome]